MKAKLLLLVFAALLTALPATAVEWNGQNGIGLRGPVFIPMARGTDFSLDHQPFMMGYDLALDLKRGISDRMAVNLTIGMANTYDDTTATDNQSTALNNSDNAYTKLKGMLFGLTGIYYFRAENPLQPYIMAGIGIDMWSLEKNEGGDSYSVTDINAKLGVGVNYWLAENMAVDLQVKYTSGQGNLSSDDPPDFYTQDDWTNWNRRPFTAYLEPSIGFSYYFGGGKDTDKDGVKDKKDNCPGTPLGAMVDLAGCPLDGDGDGVYDGLDMCPDTPKGAKVDGKGCPLDTDKDGVFDGLDKCPNTPADVKVDPQGCAIDTDGDGVPDYKDKEVNTPSGAKIDADGVGLDGDKDGVYDGLDQCPDTPAGAAVDPRGCAYDRDQDGVPDSVDACLGTPRDVKVDSTGCPFVAKIIEKITLHIKFASGSFEIDKKSKAELDSIALRIYSYPETKVEIQGFTDNMGAEDFNLKLSEDRANAVKEYLVSKGIEPGRMTATGFGENPDYFIDTNDTPEGRWNNRRVDIKSVE